MKLTDPLAALDRAVEEFGRRLTIVADEDWEAATPRTGWDVHDLVGHVAGGNRFAALILAGARADEAMDVVMSTRQLGRNPVEDFDASAAAQRDRFGETGARERLVSHPLGASSMELLLDFTGRCPPLPA